MNLNQIKKLSPLERLIYWIKERENVRLKKEQGDSPPWTVDPIISKYRFTNVRRMDDKVSKWLLVNWYKPYFNHPRMLQGVTLARFINKPETLNLITELVFNHKAVEYDKIKKTLRKHRDTGNVVFGAAYMIRGNEGTDKIECIVDRYTKPLAKKGAVELNTDSMEFMWSQYHQQYGFGSFMAGQCVADLRWAMEGTWEDKFTWAPIGPGSARGMNRLHKRPIGTSFSKGQFIQELRDLHKELAKELPDSIFNRLELHDVQNTLCETDKYNRTLFGEGSPKQIYRGVV